MAVSFKSLYEIIDDLNAYLQTAGSQIRYIDTRVGSITNAFLTAIAATISSGWMGLLDLKNSFFVSTAFGSDLDARVNDFGMIRNQGTPAFGNIIGYSANAFSVPQGSIFFVKDESAYLYVTETTAVPASTWKKIPVSATSVGTYANLSAGTIVYPQDVALTTGTTFKVATNGLDPITNLPSGDLIGGSDYETDFELKTRFPDFLLSLSRGTEQAVRQALLQVEGVSSVILKSSDPAPGYLRVSVANVNGELPIDLKLRIQTALNQWAAAGIGFIIEGIERRNTAVEVTVYVNDNTLSPVQVRTAVTAGIRAFADELTLGMPIYLWNLQLAGEVQGVENLKVEYPTQDVIAEINEILGISLIQVNVVYV